MPAADRNTYDAVIIGAGIGGLVCGCYLAKAGMKVLIVEQHHKPGGYCTSFRRGKYLFDAGPHCFGSYREGGQMRKVLRGLDLEGQLKIRRPDPCDTITTPDHRISIWGDKQRTMDELERLFSRERDHIRAFFRFLDQPNAESFIRLRRRTLADLLDNYFSDTEIKELLSLPLLAIGGLPPSRMSACVGSQFYSEFLFDGGYIPDGGMQSLPDAFARRFQEFGGTLLLSRRVKKISVAGGVVAGVEIDHEDFVPAHHVISDGDARLTFLELLSEDVVDPEFATTIRNMEPSLSSFLIYLGLDEQFRSPFNPGTVHYHFDDLDPEKEYASLVDAQSPDGRWFAIRTSLDETVAYIEMLSPFRSVEYWKRNKEMIVNRVLDKIERDSGWDITPRIACSDAATPQSLHRYTLNYQGAAYGWAGTPEQTIVPGIRKPSFVGNFFLVGHWTTLAVGISGVAYVGYDTAATLLKRFKKSKGANTSSQC